MERPHHTAIPSAQIEVSSSLSMTNRPLPYLSIKIFQIGDKTTTSTTFEGEGRPNPSADFAVHHADHWPRSSSIAVRINSITQAGGVNSIENFARSWQRAANFWEVAPQHASFVLASDHETYEAEGLGGRRVGDEESGRGPRGSLLRDHLEAAAATENAIDDESIAPEASQKPNERARLDSDFLGSSRISVGGSVYTAVPHLATPLAGSYGTSYGTLDSTVRKSSMIHADKLWRQQQVTGDIPEGIREPLILKEVEADGKIVLVAVGKSTLPQTIFNSTNVLIGVGLLSLPMGIKYAGWVCGMTFLLLSALVTSYTAGLLAKCMDTDPCLASFSDLAGASYGRRARVVTSVLFTLELLAACVALVVLFADTMDLLIPGVGVTEWKIVCGILLIPLLFAPLSLLSFTSILGIFSCFCSKSYS